MRHFLRFLSGDQRVDAERKYGSAGVIPKPKDRRSGQPVSRQALPNRDRRLERKREIDARLCKDDGDITGQWLNGIGRKTIKQTKPDSDSSPTNRLHAFLDDGGFEIEETGTFGPAKREPFNPYNRG